MERKTKYLDSLLFASSSFTIFVFPVYPIVTVPSKHSYMKGTLANFVTFLQSLSLWHLSTVSVVTHYRHCHLNVGTLLAYLFSMYDSQGRNFTNIDYHCFHVAPFVGAYLILLLGRNGSSLQIHKCSSSSSYWYLCGFKGIVLCLYIATIPTGISILGQWKSIDNSTWSCLKAWVPSDLLSLKGARKRTSTRCAQLSR